MKNLVKRLRFVFAALVIGAAVVTLFGCAQPSTSPQSIVITPSSSSWSSKVNSYASFDKKIFKADYGDWYKFFIENDEIKIFGVSLDSVMYQPVINATDAASKTYEELRSLDPNGLAGKVIAMDIAPIATYGGLMVLVETDSHTNWGGAPHSGCYIPIYLSNPSDSINVLASNSGDFSTKEEGLANLPYSKGGTWSHSATYTKQ